MKIGTADVKIGPKKGLLHAEIEMGGNKVVADLTKKDGLALLQAGKAYGPTLVAKAPSIGGEMATLLAEIEKALSALP